MFLIIQLEYSIFICARDIKNLTGLTDLHAHCKGSNKNFKLQCRQFSLSCHLLHISIISNNFSGRMEIFLQLCERVYPSQQFLLCLCLYLNLNLVTHQEKIITIVFRRRTAEEQYFRSSI